MQSAVLRALVLAAGRGERLRPLTDATPKPLLPVLGTSILERSLGRLAAAGVEAAAVNLFHLGEQIPARLGEGLAGMELAYWPETELLGTLGPLGRLGAFFAGCDPVLLVNGDSLCRWPVAAVVRAHRACRAEATLLLSSRADAESFGGGVVVDRQGRVLSFRGDGAGSRRGVFAGFHAISPDLLRDVAAEPADIVRDLYEPALERGALIRGVFTRRPWHDLGTPRRYLEGVLDAARAAASSSWIHHMAQASDGATIVGSVLEAGVRVDSGAAVEGSLLLEGATIGADSRVRDSIVGPGAAIERDAVVRGLLVTAGGGLSLATSL